jgi:hypothetical protein
MRGATLGLGGARVGGSRRRSRPDGGDPTGVERGGTGSRGGGPKKMKSK